MKPFLTNFITTLNPFYSSFINFFTNTTSFWFHWNYPITIIFYFITFHWSFLTICIFYFVNYPLSWIFNFIFIYNFLISCFHFIIDFYLMRPKMQFTIISIFLHIIIVKTYLFLCSIFDKSYRVSKFFFIFTYFIINFWLIIVLRG